jgi:hypothetical protein
MRRYGCRLFICSERLSGSLIALGKAEKCFREVRWLEDVEVGVEQPDIERKLMRRIGADSNNAAVRPIR